MTGLYIYRLTDDSGFAPCVENGLLSLVCCKGGPIRNGITYADILKQICPRKTFTTCHLDPDIRDNRIKAVNGWCPAFGHTGSAEGLLVNAGVEPGDIFLFFGWFRQVEQTSKGYKFASRN